EIAGRDDAHVVGHQRTPQVAGNGCAVPSNAIVAWGIAQDKTLLFRWWHAGRGCGIVTAIPAQSHAALRCPRRRLPMPRFRCPARARLLVAGLALAQRGDQVKTGFVNKVYKDSGDAEHKYYVFIPADYKGDKDYPCVLFLHGKGDTSAKGGLAPAIRKPAKDNPFPYIAVFPSSDKGWTPKGDGKRAIAILDAVCKEYKVDRKRIYLTGLSMGGFGTWSLATAYPERWAAIVPICGGGN